ncbi:MAG TPA: MFS transporter [Gaiellaceae bacterium]|nr:MFS transporter [Gaiellaceae bacterium]
MRLLRRTPSLLVANALSAAIQGQFMFVLPWMLLAEGSSARVAALAAGLVFVPMLFVTVPAGAISDRVDPAWLMRICFAIGLVSSAVYPLARSVGLDWFWLVPFAALVTGGLRLFVEGAVLREVGDTTTSAWLLRRQTIRSTLNQAAIFASPFVGLLAFRAGGSVAVLLLVCVLYTAALVLAAKASRTPSTVTERRRPSIAAGLASLFASPRLLWLGLAALVWNVFAGAALGMMPGVLREHAGLDELEASAAFVLGGLAVVGLTIPIVTTLQHRLDASSVFLVAAAAEGVAVVLFADARLAVLVPLIYAFFLLTNSVAAASLSGARALEVDVDHQALLNLVLIAIAIVGYLFGVLLAAGLIGAFGFGVALAVVALGLGATAVSFRRPLAA